MSAGSKLPGGCTANHTKLLMDILNRICPALDCCSQCLFCKWSILCCSVKYLCSRILSFSSEASLVQFPLIFTNSWWRLLLATVLMTLTETLSYLDNHLERRMRRRDSDDEDGWRSFFSLNVDDEGQSSDEYSLFYQPGLRTGLDN